MPNLHNINSPNPRCTPSIAGPLHRMLIPFLIACFVTTFVCDLAFWQTGDPFWATGALWLLGTGLVMAVLAVIVSLIDVLAEPRLRALNDAWWHIGGNVLAVGCTTRTCVTPVRRGDVNRANHYLRQKLQVAIVSNGDLQIVQLIAPNNWSVTLPHALLDNVKGETFGYSSQQGQHICDSR
jgi:uncharacterized membrane protein